LRFPFIRIASLISKSRPKRRGYSRQTSETIPGDRNEMRPLLSADRIARDETAETLSGGFAAGSADRVFGRRDRWALGLRVGLPARHCAPRGIPVAAVRANSVPGGRPLLLLRLLPHRQGLRSLSRVRAAGGEVRMRG